MQAFLVSLLELALFEIGLALSKHTTWKGTGLVECSTGRFPGGGF